MLWAISYSVRKVAKPNMERIKVWSDLFYSWCPYKRELDPKKYSTVQNNILKEKLFPKIQLKKLEDEVEHNLNNNTPIEQIVIEPKRKNPKP